MILPAEWITPGLVLLALALGLAYRFLGGRGHRVRKSEAIDLKKLGATRDGLPVKVFGKKATLLQFSAEYCAICPGVSRAFGKLEYRYGNLKHIEVDITNRLDLAAHFNINQTPTTFLLNEKGEIVFRVSGAPKLDLLTKELEKLGVK